jgi:hypothetical protein
LNVVDRQQGKPIVAAAIGTLDVALRSGGVGANSALAMGSVQAPDTVGFIQH